MSEEETAPLSLRAAYDFAAAHGLDREIEAIRNMVIEWDLSDDPIYSLETKLRFSRRAERGRVFLKKGRIMAQSYRPSLMTPSHWCVEALATNQAV